MAPGFHFSIINHDMVSQNDSTSLNLLWNQLKQDSITKKLLFQTPTFDPTVGFDYPEFGTWGNDLLNPQLAIKQAMQSNQNGSWMNWGGAGNFGNFSFPGFNVGNLWNNFQSPWQTPWGNSNNSGSNSGSAADKLKQSQYDKLRKVLVEYQKTASDSDKAIISTALNKSGKIGEKLDALKDAAKKLNTGSIQDALLNMDSTKIELDTAGYKLKDSKAYTDLKQNLNNLEKDIKAKKADLSTAVVCPSESDPNILKTLSYWNDTHSSDSNRNIIRLIADYLPTGSGEGTNQKASVNNIAQSLVNYVETVKSHFDSDIDFSKLDKSKQGVSDALSKCLENFNRDNILALADKVDDLYARLRMIEAERIKNNLKREYGSLNKLLGKDVVTDSLVVKATENDLKAEGISIPSDRDAVPFKEENETVIREDDPEDETGDEKIEKLTKSGEDKALKATTKKGVYQTDTVPTGENPKFYTKNEDDKLVELKDVKAIDRNGQCTMTDGSKKSLSEVEKVEVQKADVQAYNDEMKKINRLVGNKIEKCSIHFQGKNLYKSKGVDADGNHQYFTVVDGELKQIDCKYITKNSAVAKNDGSFVSQADFNEFSSISESDILTGDGRAEAQEKVKAENAERQKEIDELLKSGKLRPTNCKNPKVYCTSEKVNGRNKHYIIQNGKIYELAGVTRVLENGKCFKDDPKKGNNIGNTAVIKREEVSISDIKTCGADSSNSSIADIAKQENGAYDLGYETARDLIGYTNDDEYKNVQARLGVINKDNVIDFLKGYYANDGGGNGLFLQLGLETKKFKNKEVNPVIKAFLDAVPENLHSSKEYKEAQRIYRRCCQRSEDSDFKNFSWGWGWDRIVGTDELDQLDDAIEELMKKMESGDSTTLKTETEEKTE